MAKPKLNLRGLPIPEKIAKARQMVKAMTDNPHFATPQPALATITTAIDNLDAGYAAALAARQNAITTTNILHELEAALDVVLRQLAAYVESVSGQDESKILSAGMGVKSTSTASTAATVPAAFALTAGDHEGELDASWDKVKGASYVLERSADPPTATSWAHEAVALKSSATISGLVSGTRYWFRVAAVTSGGQSGWSDPATKIAP
jgi:hypothetical protein